MEYKQDSPLQIDWHLPRRIHLRLPWPGGRSSPTNRHLRNLGFRPSPPQLSTFCNPVIHGIGSPFHVILVFTTCYLNLLVESASHTVRKLDESSQWVPTCTIRCPARMVLLQPGHVCEPNAFLAAVLFLDALELIKALGVGLRNSLHSGSRTGHDFSENALSYSTQV